MRIRTHCCDVLNQCGDDEVGFMANRLLRRAQMSQDVFYKDAFGFKKRGNRIAEQSYLVLGQVISSLRSQRCTVELARSTCT